MGIFKKVLKLVLITMKVINTAEAREEGKNFGENIMKNKDIILNLVEQIVKEAGLSAGYRTIGLEKAMLEDLLREIEEEGK